jgi:hypothetical protein
VNASRQRAILKKRTLASNKEKSNVQLCNPGNKKIDKIQEKNDSSEQSARFRKRSLSVDEVQNLENYSSSEQSAKSKKRALAVNKEKC